MGSDISVKFGEFSTMGSMISEEEEEEEEEDRRRRIPAIVSWQLGCPDPKDCRFHL